MSNLVVQTNVLALNSHRNLKVIGTKQSQASARLSSGYRINSAADDAAGLAISEKMRAQIRGLDMASKNTQDGISLIQTAEGGMQEIDNMIQRIRELAVQASNDTNDFDTNDRQKIQDEIDQLTEGIDQMSEQVEFNAKTLLDGSLLDNDTKNELLAELNGDLTTLIGGISTDAAVSTNSGELGGAWVAAGTIALVSFASKSYSIGDAASSSSVSVAGVTVTQASIVSNNFSDFAAAKTYADSLDAYIVALETQNAAMGDGALDDEITLAKKAQEGVYELATLWQRAAVKGNSRDVVDEMPSNDGLFFQTGANSNQGINVGIARINTDVLGIGDGEGTSSVNVNIASGKEISAFIDIVDDALQYVTTQRAKLGAVQNRMEYTKSSLDISSENLSAAESRIRDTDMAKEMMKMTAANVLQQAGVSMLAQANQAPQSVLQLLG